MCARLEGGLELVQAVMVASMGCLGVVRKPKKLDEGHSPTEGKESERGVDM